MRTNCPYAVLGLRPQAEPEVVEADYEIPEEELLLWQHPALKDFSDESEEDKTSVGSPTDVEETASEAASSSNDSSSDNETEGLRPTVDLDEAEELATAALVEGHLDPGRKPTSANSRALLRHAVRKTVHYAHLSDNVRLACGKPRTEKYVEVAACNPQSLWPLCRDCFP